MHILIAGSIAVMTLFSVIAADAGQAEVDALVGTQDPALRTSLTDFIKLQAMQTPVRRPAPRTLSEWERRRKEIHGRFMKSLGLSPMPPKTPLNPKITGTLDRPEYRVEKVVFESRPGFYVTSNLYVPKGLKERAPAVLFVHGHAVDAKAAYYQNMLIGLAKQGYVVLAVDGVGFGERHQTGHRSQAMPYLVGQCVVGLEMWDNIRAVDYLLTRPEVDKGRIGVTGSSGGGLQSAYMIAVDERINCAVPVDFVATYRAFIGTGIVHCICNHVPDVMRYADLADVMALFAPRPLRIIAGEFDHLFPPNAAEETYSIVKQVYALYGAEEKVSLHIALLPHGYEADKRVSAFEWFNTWFKGDPHAVHPDVTLETKETLACFADYKLPDPHETVSTLAWKEIVKAQTARARKKPSGEELRRTIVEELFGGFPPRCPLGTRSAGAAETENYSVERKIIKAEVHMPLPVLVFFPRDGRKTHPAVIYIDPRGKSNAAVSDRVRALLDMGYAVLAPDLRGYGETYDPRASGQGDSEFLWVTDSILMGRHLFGMKVYDVTRCLDYLETRTEIDMSRVGIFGEGIGGLIGVFSAAVDPRLKWTAASGMVCSMTPEKDWLSGPLPWGPAEGKYVDLPMCAFVPNLLRYADVKDVVSLATDRPVLIEQPVNGLGQELDVAQVNKLFGGRATVVPSYGQESKSWLEARRAK